MDSTNGAIPIPINYDGGNNADLLTLTGGTATANTYAVGPSISEGTSTIVIGGITQVVRFNALEPVIDLVAGPLVVVATSADNAINYTQGSVAANGLVSIDGFETIEFSNKVTLTINALAGDDKINLNNASTPTGLTTISINGGDPTASDELVVSGTGGNDTINYAVSNTVGAGSVTITGAPTVNFTTTESLVIDGQGGTDNLTVTSPTGHRVTITPGASADSGAINSQAFGAGTASVPLTYSHIGAIGTVTLAGAGDIVEFKGTAASDTFNITGTTIQILNAAAGFVTNLFNLTNIFQLEARGLDGDDRFNVTGTLAPLTGGLVIDGGNPSASDVLNLAGAIGAVAVNLGTASVTGYGAVVSTIGIETINANAGDNNATLLGTAGVDTIEVSTGVDALTGKLVSSVPDVGSTPVVNFASIGTTMLVDGVGSVNQLVFNGTAQPDTFNLSRDPSLRSLERAGAQVVTTTNTFFAWTVRGGAGDDNFTINEPLGINGIELNLEGGSGNNALSYTTAFGQVYRPAGLNGSTLAGGALVSLTDIASAAVTLAGPANEHRDSRR